MKTTTELVNELKAQLSLVNKLQKIQGIGFQAFKILIKEGDEIREKILKLIS